MFRGKPARDYTEKKGEIKVEWDHLQPTIESAALSCAHRHYNPFLAMGTAWGGSGVLAMLGLPLGYKKSGISPPF